MNEQRTPYAMDADKGSARHIGSPPAASYLGSADIGECTIEGKRTYITWGRNLSARSQESYYANTQVMMVRIGADDGSAEIVIPDTIAKWLLDSAHDQPRSEAIIL